MTERRARSIVCAVAALAVAAVGCASTPPTITPDPSTITPTVDPNLEGLTVEVRNSELAVGEERVAFRVMDEAGAEVRSDGTMHTTWYRIIGESGEAAEAASGPAVYFASGLPGGGVWVVYAPFDSSGEWGLEISATRPDGWAGRSRLNLTVAARPSTPRVGQQVPFGDTPVAQGDLAAVTSDPSPDPALYEMTVAEAAASGRPSVVHFSSPAHCVDRLPEPSAGELCAAVLEEVKQARTTYGDRVNFVHVETHDLTDPAGLSPSAEAWGLPSEPWTFVLGRSGRVAARLEGTTDRVELGLLLDRELGTPGG